MFTRNNMRQLRNRLQSRVDQLALDLGCHVQVGDARYARDGSTCTFKVELATISKDGIANTKEIQDFKSLATLYRLSPDDLGKTFSHNGSSYVICGFASRSRKYPILAKSANGKTYKFKPEEVRMCLNAKD